MSIPKESKMEMNNPNTPPISNTSISVQVNLPDLITTPRDRYALLQSLLTSTHTLSHPHLPTSKHPNLSSPASPSSSLTLNLDSPETKAFLKAVSLPLPPIKALRLCSLPPSSPLAATFLASYFPDSVKQFWFNFSGDRVQLKEYMEGVEQAARRSKQVYLGNAEVGKEEVRRLFLAAMKAEKVSIWN
mmetsp:Transcript_43207/g.50692  ORF Transcript_43207/g.50692 Transcript_43207/m.50692 type:complete len:188 (+) Transcript_43207:234-797(+)